MRNILIMLAILASAMTLPAQAEVRVATIRAGELVRESPQYKSAEQKMKKEFERRFKEIESDGKKLAEDVKAFQRDADVMSPDERARVEKELNSRRIDQSYAQQKFNEDSMVRQRQLAEEIMKSIAEVIKGFAAKEGYDVVLQDPVYAAPSIDITDDVLKELRKRK